MSRGGGGGGVTLWYDENRIGLRIISMDVLTMQLSACVLVRLKAIAEGQHTALEQVVEMALLHYIEQEDVPNPTPEAINRLIEMASEELKDGRAKPISQVLADIREELARGWEDNAN